MLRSQPDLALKIIDVLCTRLRRTTEQVEDLMFLDLQARLVNPCFAWRIRPVRPAGSP